MGLPHVGALNTIVSLMAHLRAVTAVDMPPDGKQDVDQPVSITWEDEPGYRGVIAPASTSRAAGWGAVALARPTAKVQVAHGDARPKGTVLEGEDRPVKFNEGV